MTAGYQGSLRQAGEGELYVVDTSTLIEGMVSKLVKEGKIGGRVIVHKASVAELEHQATEGKQIGFAGLAELRELRSLSEKGLIEFEIAGEPPRPADIKHAGSGFVDSIIRDYAWEVGATLITSDRVQALVAEAMGVKVLYIAPRSANGLSFERFFDKDTMSIHLREGVVPLAKRGRPGEWAFTRLGGAPLTRADLEQLAREIIEAAKRRSDSFIEIDRLGSTIVQLGKYRVVITRPPLSTGWEITIVRPLVRLKLEDYRLPEKLMRRLEERAEGILIAGAPGMGKTTFAQALAEFYARKNKVVKTIESPRDMQLPPHITQYSKTYASGEELHDILLLSRPDYTVFDEMRNDEDFRLYVDLRLAGIGMVGVVHATSPIDAIQRFLGRVELGMIPSIIDTVIFINKGVVEKVYEVSMTVKLPTGLKEADLSRPVVEVRDFLTGELEYEIYTFGEQTIVVPVKRLAAAGIESKVKHHVKRLIPEAEVELRGNVALVKIPREDTKLAMKKIRKLRKIGDKLGVEIKLTFLD